MTAHKPATPLPWKFRAPLYQNPNGTAPKEIEILAVSNGIYKPYVADVRSIGEDGKDGTKQDAAYIVRACNAYPKLVKALRDIINDSDPGMGRGIALLRELGEAE